MWLFIIFLIFQRKSRNLGTLSIIKTILQKQSVAKLQDTENKGLTKTTLKRAHTNSNVQEIVRSMLFYEIYKKL